MGHFVKIIIATVGMSTIGACSADRKKIDLIDHTDKHSHMLVLTAKDRLLANIKSETAVVKSISEVSTLVGKTVIDERSVKVASARVNGRLDKLFLRNPGAYITQGEAIYSIYSEELLADESDYLRSVEQYQNATTQKEFAKQLLDASLKKLLLWTLTKSQIEELEHTKRISPLITFYSPYSGYLTELSVREGEYVNAGSPVLKIANFNSLWVELQVYSNELKYLQQTPSFLVEFEAYPDVKYVGNVVYHNPALEEEQKISLVRLEVNNSNGKLKPGMMAYIYLRRNERTALVIPKRALLLESSTSVWVEDSDGMFEQRMVKIGIENKSEVEVLSGIQPGEKVVVSGAYFLKSESVIRQGGGDMGGMKM